MKLRLLTLAASIKSYVKLDTDAASAHFYMQEMVRQSSHSHTFN